MKSRLLFVTVLPWALSACAVSAVYNIGRLAHFSSADARPVIVEDDVYNVFDKPQDSRMMVSAGPGVTLRRGPRHVFDDQSYLAPFRAAAEKYFKDNGRNCAVTEGWVIVRPHAEFSYRCDPRRS